MTVQYYLPTLDPWIDLIGGIGFIIGIATAVYLVEAEQHDSHRWLFFIALAFVFGLLAAEGGRFDPFRPGTFRIIALVILLTIELVSAKMTADEIKENTKQALP